MGLISGISGGISDPAFTAALARITELESSSGAILETVTTETVLGRGSPGTGDVEELSITGGLEIVDGSSIRRSALTGDVTASLGSGATTIANDAVSNAKLANMATQTFKGRTTAGTGDPEDLTVTQATALLNEANATTKGLVPTPPNNTTTYLRGDATFAAPPKKKMVLWYGGAVMTAGDTNRFANPAGFSTSPIGATGLYIPCPVTGNLTQTIYHTNTAHSTNTVTIAPRVNGVEQTTQTATISASDTDDITTHGTPLAVTAGDSIACQMDHNGATNLANLSVGFVIEYD